MEKLPLYSRIGIWWKNKYPRIILTVSIIGIVICFFQALGRTGGYDARSGFGITEAILAAALIWFAFQWYKLHKGTNW
ncbi:MAG: hypothetical protein MUC87_10130 [Bacteroidia bacterium]|jgi:hypothetical protein|nr:hypothetical protein [Bacteroidia bacterium]